MLHNPDCETSDTGTSPLDVNSFEDGNLLPELKDFADRLNKFIKVERDFFEGSLVLALTSEFGSGKSTFLKMWKNSLENKDHDEQDAHPKTLAIMLNAWESDYYGDPLFAIVSSLIDALDNDKDNVKHKALVDAVKDIGRLALSVSSQMATHALKTQLGVDMDLLDAEEYAVGKKKERETANLEAVAEVVI